ncbi:unnamed protein product [Paramecium pentaurelia]|uniref:Uncharacterized protein n=1 Tax=Paramecium pentaurelia TaxID=43138 RepID=A0A8S1WES6_9CILI|nr:unnamed protein product [Paramecium pentaurelia]
MNIFEKSKCCVCQKVLQILLMRFFSKCKRCHQDVCLSCSSNRIKLYSIPNEMVKELDKPQRVCDNCYRDYLYYQDLINQYKLQWNTRSLLMNKLLGNKKGKIKIQQPLEFYEKQNIEKDILTGRSDSHLLNYSIREFVTQCQQGLEQQQIRNSIIRVLELFVAHNPTIGYCQGMNYIAIICLCIADEEGAFFLMNHLFNVIIPPRFFSNSSGASLIGYQAEINFLKEMISVNDFQNKEILIQFIELQGPQLLLTLMIQVLNISSLLVTWIQMFKIKSFVPIDKVLLYTLNITTRDIDFMQPKILNNIGKFVHYANLIELFQKDEIYFTKFERTLYIEQYYSKTSRSWVQNDPIILNKLKKISNLDIDEITTLQTQFKKYCLEKRTISIDQQQRQSLKQLAQLTDSSDEDADDQYREILIIQSFKLQKYGINIDTFLYFMEIFLRKECQHYSLDQEKLQLIFNLFDENKSELLDFREFLICLTILLRGSFADKFKMLFTAHTQNILKFQDFETLLSLLIPQDIQQTIEYKEFLQRIVQPYFTYFDMLKVLKDPLIVQIEIQNEKNKHKIKKLNSYIGIIDQ